FPKPSGSYITCHCEVASICETACSVLGLVVALDWTALDVELRCRRLVDVLPILRKLAVQDTALTAEPLHNLGTAACVQLRAQHIVQLGPDGLEELGSAHPLYEVIALALILDVEARLVR